MEITTGLIIFIIAALLLILIMGSLKARLIIFSIFVILWEIVRSLIIPVIVVLIFLKLFGII